VETGLAALSAARSAGLAAPFDAPADAGFPTAAFFGGAWSAGTLEGGVAIDE
jgi:hypothetical protein